jgi:hypothetical protein
LTYVVQIPVSKGQAKLIKKTLEYAIVSTFIDFDPDQFGAKLVIVDGKVAIKLKGRVYVEI